MRYKKRRFEINLIISYAVIIAMVVLSIGVAYNFYFLDEYTNEIVAVNNQKIENISEILHKTVVASAEHTILAMSRSGANNTELQTMMKFPELVDSVTVRRAYDFLGDLVSQRMDILHHIDVYMPTQRTLISSLYGSKNLDQPSSGITLQWLVNACKSPLKRKWDEIGENEIYNGSPELLVYIQGMALASNLENSRTIFAIYFKKDAVSSIMQQDTLNTVLLNSEQNILMGDIINQRLSVDSASELINSPKLNNNVRKVSMAGKDYLVSETVVPLSELVLFNFWPFDMIKIRQTQMWSIFSLLLGIVIAMGSFLSYIFFKGLSKPLILLSENRQILKKNIMLDAINKKISHKELNLRLDIIEKQLPYEYFSIVLISFDRLEQFTDLKTDQVILFDIIDKLDQYDDKQILCIAADIGETEVFALVNSNTDDITDFIDYVQKILSRHNNAAICCAGTTKETYKLESLYNSGCIMKKFAYFFPYKRVIEDVSLILREESKEELPQSLLSGFQAALSTNSIEQIESAFDAIKKEMQTGSYSYNVCQSSLMSIANELSKFLSNNGIKSSEVIDDTLFSVFSKIKNIDAFERWIFSVYSSSMDIMQDRNDKRNDTVMEKACLFIEENLSKGIGVAEVAEHVQLNPQYFGRLFRETMGVNARDYMSTKQIEKVAHLLKTTSLSVEEIATLCGFGSGNYLIKKFKKIYSVTPSIYRQNSH